MSSAKRADFGRKPGRAGGPRGAAPEVGTLEDRLVAMVALPSPNPLDPDAVAEAMAAYLEPGDPRPEVVKAGVEETNSFVVTVGPWTVAVLMFPFPIPPATLADALGNELMWKDAAETFDVCKGHCLLAVINPNTDPAVLVNQARLLTVAAAGVLAAGNGLGVFWSPANSVIPPDRFFAETSGLMRTAFASGLWFGLRFYPSRAHDLDNKIVCQSTGLTVFLGREVECGPYDMKPADLAERVLSVSRYMATSGPIFADGHTFSFSGSADPDARLRYRWSPLGGVNRPVFGLELLDRERSR